MKRIVSPILNPDGSSRVTLEFDDGSRCRWPPEFGFITCCPGRCKVEGLRIDNVDHVAPGSEAYRYIQANLDTVGRKLGRCQA